MSGTEPLAAPATAHANLLTEVERTWQDDFDDDARDDAVVLSVLAHASAAIDGHLLVIGAGHGLSAMALGAAARAAGRGRVFAVDLYPDADEPAGSDAGSLDHLLNRLTEARMLSWVLPHHGTAGSFAQLMPADFRCRMIHLASAHACTHVGTDVFLLERMLAPGGWLTFGAGFTSWPGAGDALDVVARQRPDLVGWRWLTPRLLAVAKNP